MDGLTALIAPRIKDFIAYTIVVVQRRAHGLVNVDLRAWRLAARVD